MAYLPLLGLIVPMVAMVAWVAWPTRAARPESLLQGVHHRAIGVIVLLGAIAVAAGFLAQASAAREAALALPVGPEWAPDVGVDDVARAGGIGLLLGLFAGPCALVFFVLDALAWRRLRTASTLRAEGTLDTGLGDDTLERPPLTDYRTDATPDVAVKGGLALARRLLRRALVADAVALLLLGLMFLVNLASSLARAMY